MAYSAPRLRPLGAGDLLDEMIRLFRRHIRIFAGIGAGMLVPAAFQLVVEAFFNPDLGDSSSLGTTIGITMLTSMVVVVMSFVVYAAVIFATADVYLGRQTTVGSAYARALRRFWPMVGVSLVYIFVITLLTVTLVGIPVAMYLTVAWWFCTEALLLEGVGVGQALGRSRALVRGHWWRVAGVSSLVLLIVMFLYMIFLVPSSILVGASLGLGTTSAGPLAATSYALGVLVSAVGGAFFQVLVACGWVLLYYDLRVRKEGFDLELLAGTAEEAR